eukprot:Opistho-1_new@17265
MDSADGNERQAVHVTSLIWEIRVHGRPAATWHRRKILQLLAIDDVCVLRWPAGMRVGQSSDTPEHAAAVYDRRCKDLARERRRSPLVVVVVVHDVVLRERVRVEHNGPARRHVFHRHTRHDAIERAAAHVAAKARPRVGEGGKVAIVIHALPHDAHVRVQRVRPLCRRRADIGADGIAHAVPVCQRVRRCAVALLRGAALSEAVGEEREVRKELRQSIARDLAVVPAVVRVKVVEGVDAGVCDEYVRLAVHAHLARNRPDEVVVVRGVEGSLLPAVRDHGAHFLPAQWHVWHAHVGWTRKPAVVAIACCRLAAQALAMVRVRREGQIAQQ